MPTESAFLLAGLLFLAAALGYLFARFGDSEQESPQALPVNRDYIKGLNFLLDEDSDSALEVFARMAELDDDALEIHFALGSLFRRRGEVDRAIRIHQNIMARPGLERDQKGQAQMALAEDYMSAGLLDRAESLYSKLRNQPKFRARALYRLMRIYELTRDWQEAIEAHDELARLEPGGEQVGHVAHYYCELAEQAMAAGDLPGARDLLKRADAVKPKTVRTALVRARLEHRNGDWKEAVRLYQRVADDAPELVCELVSDVAAIYREQDDAEGLGIWLEKLLGKGGAAMPAVARAVIADAGIQDPVALEAFARYLESDPVLRELVDVDRLRGSDGLDMQRLERVRKALGQMLAGSAAWRCRVCGYASMSMLWQCPGCRSWESLYPEFPVSFPKHS